MKIRKLINKSKKLKILDNTKIKKFGDRIQTQKEIFNITNFNQSNISSIDKFFYVNNEVKYIVSEIKNKIKIVIKKLILNYKRIF